MSDTNGTFDQFDLSQTTKNALATMGYKAPTPVQAEAIGPVLDGRDVIVQARTGTGKTAAFGIPVVENTQGKRVQTIVLTPTRELANQVKGELNEIGRGAPFKAESVYGGVGYGRQKAALNGNAGVTCIVACPGRLLDILDNMGPDLSSVTTVILDEADRMLDMGFQRDIEAILKHMPNQRQTLLFSATIPDGIRRVAKRHQHDPVTVTIGKGSVTTPLTDQYRVRVDGNALAPLLTLLERENPERAVVFTETKHTAKRMAAKLNAAGHDATALQGNMSQSKRDKAMARFRQGKTRILVATDVAARGLDVDELTHVIQFDVPQRPEDHVHRTGRTGRAGREGRAFLFTQPHHEGYARKIEREAGIKLTSYDLGDVPHVPENIFKAGPKPRNYESISAGGRKR